MSPTGNLSPAHTLSVNHLADPIGIGDSTPSLSWKLPERVDGLCQRAYRILAKDAGTGDCLWDSGEVSSEQTTHVLWGGQPLASRQQVEWSVRYSDQTERWSAWSQKAVFETGLLDPSDWPAGWIGTEPNTEAAPVLRRLIHLDKPVKQARLTITALGWFEARLNGTRVGDDELAPGWTDYHKRVEVLTYDVTSQLTVGENMLAVALANGWYAGYLGYENKHGLYGQQPSLLAQLEIVTTDGKQLRIPTNANWEVTEGPWLEDDIYHGVTYDASREAIRDGQGDGWRPAVPHDIPEIALNPKQVEPVRAQASLKPVSSHQLADGTTVYDFGQNLVGWARLAIKIPAGSRVTLRHAEMLNDNGTLYLENLRTARATDVFIGDGKRHTFEPVFTFHGFRYLEVSCDDGTANLGEPTAVVLHSDCQPTGSFQTSNEDVNRLQSCITWGQKGNFLDVPTDCPQRDERLGWTGDAQVFIRTAAFNWNVAPFFRKWCRDMRDAQCDDGGIPHVAPDILRRPGSVAGWADAVVICPWTIYRVYGDTRILEENYDSMQRWIDHQRENATDLIRPELGFGDWLSVDAVSPARAPTPSDLIGTAYFFHTARLMGKIASLLRKEKDAAAFATLAEEIRRAFLGTFVSEKGRLVGDTQTGYLLAIGFELLDGELHDLAAGRLINLVERDRHLTTGFLGTPLLCPVLTRLGRTDLAYELLLRREYPSWLYPIDQGATTMWERWNSYTRKDGFGDAAMNSFNHYAYGAIGEWLYAVVGGIELDPEIPAYRRSWLQPRPGGGLTWAKTSLQTTYGQLACDWQFLSGNRFQLQATVPPNTEACLKLPAGMTLKEISGPASQDHTDKAVTAIAQPGTINILAETE